MTNGTSQGLFIVVAIVIFGIFVSMSYVIFGDEMAPALVDIFGTATEQVKFDKNADYNIEGVVPSEESDFIFDGINKIIGYKGTDTEIVIPNEIDGLSVTKISGDAFNNKGLTKIIMPNSLTTIEDGTIDGENVIGAFANNTIQEIHFSANLKYIGSFAFFAGVLEDIVLPEGLKSIGESAFENNNLTDIVIPSTVESLGDNTFKDNSLTSVSYKNGGSLKNIGNNVFSGNNISNLEIPKGTTNIAENAYSNAGLESVKIPNGITSIGKNAFSGNNLTHVTIPEGVVSIGEDAFRNNKLTEVDIPSTVKEIEKGSFMENELAKVSLPDGLTSIGDYAFYKNKLPVISLPESLLNIGIHAFGYNQLEDVKIPSNLTELKDFTFSFNIMPVKPSIPTNIKVESETAFYGNLFKETNAHADYYGGMNVEPTSADSFAVDSTGTITNYTGTDTEVVIPYEINGVEIKNIGNYAFSRYKWGSNKIAVDLTSVVIPDTVVDIGDYAFASDENNATLKEVTFGDSVESIGYGAFYYSAIEEVIIPDSVKTIGASAFNDSGSGFYSIKKLTLGKNVETIGDYAFNFSGISELTIPASVQSLGRDAFSFNANLSEVTLLNPNTTLGANALGDATPIYK